jgi:undecaprenyl-diphosphatase
VSNVRVATGEGEDLVGSAVVRPDVTVLSRRQAIVLATGALTAFVVFAVLALVPWPALRGIDAHAPAAGHDLLVYDMGLRIVARTVTDLGSSIAVDIVAAVAAVVWLLARRWRLAVVLAVARLGELVTAWTVKTIVHRPRPDLVPQLTSAGGTSFPSGHTAGSMAVYGTIVVLLCASLATRERVWAIVGVGVLVAAVAASRVLLGVHYPTDVLAGAALGLCWVAVALAIVPRARSAAEPG